MIKAFLALLLLSIIFTGCSSTSSNIGNGIKATVYKSPTCGCCEGYISYLEGTGFDVQKVNIKDMDSIKTEYNIPKNMESCHTTIIGDYVIEGHVPIEAVEKLLREKPDISGIALPDMPAGTPGMPGIKMGQYRVYALEDGKVSDYILI